MRLRPRQVAAALGVAVIVLGVIAFGVKPSSSSPSVRAAGGAPPVQPASDPAVETAALQGEYVGEIESSDERLAGLATITIRDGNQITIEAANGTYHGRITASRTGNYVSASINLEGFGEGISVDVRKVGDDKLVLKSVSGNTQTMDFKPRPPTPTPTPR